MVDDRESEGVRPGDAEEAQAQNAEVMPVSDETGGCGDGDPDDQDDHQDKGGRDGQLKTEGKKQEVDDQNVDQLDQNREPGDKGEERRIDHDPETLKEMMDEAIKSLGIACRQFSAQHG